jgi:hemerythrin
MNAIKLLRAQHRKVEELFEQIEKAEGSGREQRILFSELAENIESHAKIEEKFFYPAGQKIDKDLTFESYEEHDLVRALIRKIKKTPTRDDSFKAKVTVLKELIEHHVEEEEDDYFPECEKTLGEVSLEELGNKMEIMFERLMSKASGKSRTHKHLAA